MIILGLCCISKALQERKPVVKCRTIQKKYYTVERAIETAKQNLDDVYSLVRYAADNKIFSLRLPSDILPRYTDQTVERYNMEQFQIYFDRIGDLARRYNIRLSFHPDQFVVLSSDNENILRNSFEELSYQCEMLLRMGVSAKKGVCNIHGGGVYGLDKAIVKERWANNYKLLPEHVKRYLTLENDEKSYSLEDCLDISKLCGVSVVFDAFHEECYRASDKHTEEFKPLEMLVDETLKTWRVEALASPKDLDEEGFVQRIPMAHVSNQRMGDRTGAHADYIDTFPDILFYYAEQCEKILNLTLCVDVEAKEKDLALFRLRERYSDRMN